jgi:hypothetical protein
MGCGLISNSIRLPNSYVSCTLFKSKNAKQMIQDWQMMKENEWQCGHANQNIVDVIERKNAFNLCTTGFIYVCITKCNVKFNAQVEQKRCQFMNTKNYNRVFSI